MVGSYYTEGSCIAQFFKQDTNESIGLDTLTLATA